MYRVEKEQVANYLINRTGLNADLGFLEILDRLSCIQADPINTVARSHEIALFNRNKNFEKPSLYKALYTDRSLFEFWMQRYSIIPIRFFPFLNAMIDVPESQRGEKSYNWKRSYEKAHRKEIRAVLKHILNEGPTTGKNLAHLPKGKPVLSWNQKESQQALLEFLWIIGEITICGRNAGSRCYDLTERVIPREILKQKVSQEEAYRFLLNSHFKYLGIIRTAHLNRSGLGRVSGLRKELKNQLENGEVGQISIITKNAKKPIRYFIKTTDLPDLENATNRHKGLNILPPLDPLVIDRELLEDLFGFSYRWEAYTPVSKRKIGAYNMPILYDGHFIGQIDLARDGPGLRTNHLSLHKDSYQIRKSLKQAIVQLGYFCVNSL